MTFLDAPAFDAVRARRIRNARICAVAFCVLAPILIAFFWNWPSAHRINTFFGAVEQQDYPKAFGIWRNDANWQLHQERFSDYPYTQFLKDWGPISDFRVVNSHKILYATSHLGNVVLLAVEVHASNSSAVEVHASNSSIVTITVSKKDHTLCFSPFDLKPGEKKFGLTRWEISRKYD